MRLDKLSAGSRWRMRPDGPEKTTGELRYLTDLSVPGMLYGKVLRSPFPHALVLDIRTSRAERAPGVKAVITHRDVPGLNGFGIVTPDQPVLCADRVRYVGDAIAAVAAESEEEAEYALTLIEADFEPLPAVTEPEAAMREDAPRLHPGGNILHRTSFKKGDAGAAFANCAFIAEHTYRTPRQMHAYMETEGGLFIPEPDGRLTVRAATQHGYKDRMQLSRILAVPEDRIRIVSSPIGGSFGGKDELNVQPYGALLAIKTGRPVKMHNSRRESVRAGLKRHPMKLAMKTGADASGRLIAHQVRIVADTGAYSTLGAPVLNFATEHASGPYRIPNVDIEGFSVFTNNGVSGEFRGFGGNQVIFAVEGQMDRLAEAAGIDPWEFRLRNLRKPEDPGPLGQRIWPTDGVRQAWEGVAASALWKERGASSAAASLPWLKRGVGAALAMHGSGLGYGIPDPGGGRLSLNADGKIEAAFSFEEFGQGILATLEAMLTGWFGCGPDDLHIVIGDTDLAPHSGSSTASRSTTVAHLALRQLAPKLKAKLLELASDLTGRPPDGLTTGNGGIWAAEGGGGSLIGYRELAEACGTAAELSFDAKFEFPVTPDPVTGGHYLYTSTAVAVEVEVNELTGSVRLLGQHHAVAAGPVVNPMGYLGQIEGGSSMAQGFALQEDARMEEGRYRIENLDGYLIPTIRDMAETFTVDAIEELPEGDPYGPRGVGEIGSVALAPAIAEAVYRATGKRVETLPIRREELIVRFAGAAVEREAGV